jgi:hypothetical protein
MTESPNSSGESKSSKTSSESLGKPKRKYVRRKPLITLEPDPAPAPAPDVASFPQKNLALEMARSVGLDPRLGFCVIAQHGDREIFVLTYRGILRLAMESGEIAHFSAQPVFERDDFALDLGANLLKHAPWAGEEGPGALVGAYAQVIDTRGSRQIAYLPGRKIYERSNQLFKENMTAQELAKKIVSFELVGDSYLTLPALRLAIAAELTAVDGRNGLL